MQLLLYQFNIYYKRRLSLSTFFNKIHSRLSLESFNHVSLIMQSKGERKQSQFMFIQDDNNTSLRTLMMLFAFFHKRENSLSIDVLDFSLFSSNLTHESVISTHLFSSVLNDNLTSTIKSIYFFDDLPFFVAFFLLRNN